MHLCYWAHLLDLRIGVLCQLATFSKRQNLTDYSVSCLLVTTQKKKEIIFLVSPTPVHTRTLRAAQGSPDTCGVSFPTLCVIGSLITTSTLQTSFSLGMENLRSSSDRKTDCPFITFTPRLTLMKEEHTTLSTISSSRNSQLFSKGFMFWGYASSFPPVKMFLKKEVFSSSASRFSPYNEWLRC